MTDECFQLQLTKLRAEIAKLPPAERERLERLAAETQLRQDAIRASIEETYDALADWQIASKYAVFDLECRNRTLGGQA